MWGVEFIGENDWLFLFRVLSIYKGSWLFIGLYIAALAMLCLRNNKKLKEIFCYPFLVQLLTIFNIFILQFFIPKFDLTLRYYRFFWILPIGILLGLLSMALLERMKRRLLQGFMFVVLLISMVWSSTEVAVYKRENVPNLAELKNELKVPVETIYISKIIHSEGIKNPVVIYDFMDILTMRQYDASIISPIGREDILDDAISQRKYSLEEIQKVYQAEDYVTKMKLFVAYGEPMKPEILEQALKALRVDYMVLTRYSPASNNIASLGFKSVGSYGDKIVYRVCSANNQVQQFC